MRKFGLIGYPLSHSFSPGYFADKFEKEGIRGVSYQAFPLETVLDLEKLVEDELIGLNVTIPYKEQVIPLLDEIAEDAAEIAAVNTIHFQDGKRIGYNTDTYGFKTSLLNWVGELGLPSHALILGSGGASKAVAYVLKQLGMEYFIVSRKDEFLRYSELTEDIVQTHKLIINTTPLGMSPQIDAFPDIDYSYLGEDHFCYDLVYNPEVTRFLQKASEHGAKTKNGFEMLILQAEKSWEIWNS